jgi:hypothetical protein
VERKGLKSDEVESSKKKGKEEIEERWKLVRGLGKPGMKMLLKKKRRLNYEIYRSE